MGRAKLKMELISNEKKRHSTFQKRNKGLKKKAYELSTLCDVNVCMIIYGPKQNEHHSMELGMWPSNPHEIQRMIELFKNRSEQDRNSRTHDLSDFFEDRTRKVEEEVEKLRKKNDNEAKYPSWDQRYNTLSEEHLRQLSSLLDDKVAVAKDQLELMKLGNQSSEVIPGGGIIDCTTPIQYSSQTHPYYFRDDDFTRNMHLNFIHDQYSISSVNPCQYYSPMDQAYLMMMHDYNNSYCNQLASSSSNAMHVHLLDSPTPMPLPLPLIDNMVVNNPRPTPMLHYMHYPIISSTAPSQMHAPAAANSQYYDHQVDEFQMKNQK
ncbi:MADS-box transcription factor PHERES 2-like [Cornus florida]|uniref:MADS-box transcription factor PHERES 2-like n=1 Tax=Cornus florida TaxID=4283 RepID=UPI0028A2D53D|nr:MADS-box transcription factor PHERES 2-like [Cornus florida]